MSTFDIHPVSKDRWNDLEKLFGSRGACGGCWCMWWRLTRSEFENNKGDGNRRALRKLIQSGEEPGLLAYDGNDPVGWICIGPRERYSTLERSRVLAPVDDQPVWSVVCFFIARGYRRQGVSKVLLEAALEFARKKGAGIIEGYPWPKKDGKSPDPFVYTGLEPIFDETGFEVVARRGKTGRGIWRKYL